jgi:hypothetical protein
MNRRLQDASRSPASRRCCAAALLVALLLPLVAMGEVADVYLKSGLRLRGEIEQTATEIIIHNQLGTCRVLHSDVVRIVPVPGAVVTTAPATAPAETPDTSPTTQPAADVEPSAPAGTGSETAAPASAPAEGERVELEPAPRITDADIYRLRMHELTLDGPAEDVRVRFVRKPGQQDLTEEVLERLRLRTDFQPRWEEILTDGEDAEQLQLILRETGFEYADRIAIESDPRAFHIFRRRVLPLVAKSCARSGCHSGTRAHLVRFPVGSTRDEEYAYTAFVLLDEWRSAHGPLIDRDSPDNSVLLDYLLPQELTERPHPTIERGPPYRAVVRDRTDPAYDAVRDWINYLIVPRPDYGLAYENPYASPALERGASDDADATPAEKQPTPPTDTDDGS